MDASSAVGVYASTSAGLSKKISQQHGSLGKLEMTTLSSRAVAKDLPLGNFLIQRFSYANPLGKVLRSSLRVTSIWLNKTLNNTAHAEDALCTTTADATGAFSCSFEIAIGQSICVAQVDSSGTRSTCLDKNIPADLPPIKLGTIIDVSIDEATHNLYVLGRDSSNVYKLKIFSNDSERLLGSVNLSSLSDVVAASGLTSVAAYNGTVHITAAEQGNIYKFSVDANYAVVGSVIETVSISSNQFALAARCPMPIMGRFDPTLYDNEVTPRYFVVCSTDSNRTSAKFTEYDINFNKTNTTTVQNENALVFTNDFNASLSYSTNHVWQAAIQMTNSSTNAYSIDIDSNGLYFTKVQNLNRLFKSYSSGKDGNKFYTLGVDTTNNIAGRISIETPLDNSDEPAPDFISQVSTTSDAVCKSRSDCSQSYVLSNTESLVYTYDLSGADPSAVGSTSVGGLNPTRLIVDDSLSKIAIIDSLAMAVYWVEVF